MARFLFDSRKEACKSPFGAQKVGSELTLRVALENDQVPGSSLSSDSSPSSEPSPCPGEIRLQYIYGLRDLVPAEEFMTWIPEDRVFEMTLMLPLEPCLFFYRFAISQGGETSYLIPEDPLSGRSKCVGPDQVASDFLAEASLGDSPEPTLPQAWQVTVYEDLPQLTSNYEGELVYQIFPDRFAYVDTPTPEVMAEKSGPRAKERIFHSVWGEEVDFTGKEDQGYMALDFFGGTLAGIQSKLDYLQGLGVKILYLNPIFEARSNHRYDTGNYQKVDPLLGTNDNFRQLAFAARKRGIKVILDGVFNHTGADSLYFDKYGHYRQEESQPLGAYPAAQEGQASPYASWYRFHRQEDGTLTYDSWWGFEDLPDVDEHVLSYRQFIMGPQGIIRQWLDLGASGFRLDVADELPDAFLEALRTVMHRHFLIGEVWEDASNKISYSRRRSYLLGHSLNTVMGYPFRLHLLRFLLGEIGAETLVNALESIREHYPRSAFYTGFHFLSTHDTARAFTVLSGVIDPGDRPRQAEITLTPEERSLARSRTLLALCFQTLYPGNLCLYYGDEYGAEGFRDPFNRRCMDWDDLARQEKTPGSFTLTYRQILQLRQIFPFLQKAEMCFSYAKGSVVVLERWQAKTKEGILLMMNAGDQPVTLTPDQFTQGPLVQLMPKSPIDLGPYGAKVYTFPKVLPNRSPASPSLQLSLAEGQLISLDFSK